MALDRSVRSQYHSAGPVGRLRTVACSDRTLGSEHRAQSGQYVRRGTRTRAFVNADNVGLLDDLTALKISDAVPNCIRSDLILELASFDRSQRTPMALDGERVLRIARHFPLLSNLFRSNAHAIGNSYVLAVSKDTLIGDDLVTTHRNHAHALGAGANHDVGFAETYAIGGNGNRIQPG